jgi:hypothetical protein
MALIVVAGQSNALGWVEASSLPAHLQGPLGYAAIWNPTRQAFEALQAGVNTGNAQQPTAVGPEVQFAYAWSLSHPGETLFIVKVAQSSTGLAEDPLKDDWSPRSGELFATASQQVAAARQASGEPVSGVLWMQGEEDASTPAKALSYEANLAELFARMRTDWGGLDTAIVFGRVDAHAGLPYAGPVRQAQAAIDLADGAAVMIDTDSFPLQGDKLHFNAAGQIALGEAMWRAYEYAPRQVMGGGAGDRLRAAAGNDSLYGGGGNDTLVGGDGDNLLRGEAGDDWLTGGGQFDDLHGNTGDDTLRGGGGGDWVVGGKDQDLLYGDAGADVVLGNLGLDTCYGGDGDDVVRGGQGDDMVHGEAGDDWLSGDRGDDTVYGGAGADTFHLFHGSDVDRVMDFNRSEGDRVNLLPGSQYSFAQVGADVVITGAGGGQMVLVNVSAASLTGDWIFVA